ncbi:hypothetical protein B0J13DRAFT_556918 [Dactylonectria estremocensis]|uniref:Uncharacterized protein n=1 Tax=Dactylonectria estremocensis TaxID=1079267 RepID=A0A9P9J485_9HYPO|nr:hypothetical protein B0J13DRAFT_556918 [Dactylonectria estremocensis]
MAATPDCPMCTICGIRIFESSSHRERTFGSGPFPWAPDVWKTSGIVITGPHWPSYRKGPVLNDSVRRHIATPTWDPAGMDIHPLGPRVSTQVLYSAGAHDGFNPTTEQHWYLGIHSACEDIAKLVIRRSREARIRSMGDLWMILDQRCTKTDSEHFFGTSFLPEIPENLPGEPLELSLSRYYLPFDAIPGDQADARDFYEWYEDDPLFIPDLTRRIISNLQKYEPTAETVAQSVKEFEELPQEVKDNILHRLLDQPLALDCTYSIPAYHWKQAFLNIPFLWDLDKSKVDKEILKAKLAGIEWDWEKITRQLMTPVTICDQSDDGDPIPWNYDQVGLTVPHGLNNRRRIWQILEEMYPNDVELEDEE